MARNLTVDLYSDTQTRPSPAMRAAMAGAEVGDEQRDEDPTVLELCHMVADLLGKEAALFLPSGTMCNEIAYRTHTSPGDEIILHAWSHAMHFETGAPAALSGVMLRTVDGARGMFGAEQVRGAIRRIGNHEQRSRLLSVENTTNLGGGAVWDLDDLAAVTAAARAAGLATHMDGARLMNAVVASGQPASAFARDFDSVWIDMSKGLGAPVGGVLAGSTEFIAEARRHKHQFGGAMRQAGIIAAGGVYALRHNVERLAEDHDNARRLAEGIGEVPGVHVDLSAVETNMVYFDVDVEAERLSEALLEHGVRIGPMGPNRLRAVTHLDVDANGIATAVSAVGEAMRSLRTGD